MKKRIGGKVVYIPVSQWRQNNTAPPPPPTPAPAPPVLDDDDIINGVNPNAVSSSDAFWAMTESERVDAIADAVASSTPLFLTDSYMQRASFYLGLDGKPEVVSDATLDAISGTDLYRTVKAVRNTSIGMTFSGNEICDQTLYGDFTRYSGTSAHGVGLYFADTYGGSRIYGSGLSSDRMMRMKLNKNARILPESQADRGVQAEISKGTKLGKILQNADYDSRSSLYTIAKGYNVIYDRYSGYYVVLDRSAMTMSDKYINPNGRSRW